MLARRFFERHRKNPYLWWLKLDYYVCLPILGMDKFTFSVNLTVASAYHAL